MKRMINRKVREGTRSETQGSQRICVISYDINRQGALLENFALLYALTVC